MPRHSADLKEVHELIRRGRGAAAREILSRLTRRGVPRGLAGEFANLAWRAGLPELGARVLNPIVRGEARRGTRADIQEKAEYGVCLVKLGAVTEGLELLRSLDRDAYPEITLYEAFAHIAAWEYGAAVPLLLSYLERKNLDHYARLVGNINLASAYVYERQHKRAEPLLRGLLHEASVRKLTLALGTVLELSAGNFIFQRKWQLASPLLERAEAELAGSKSPQQFYVEKWKGILRFLKETPHDPRVLDAIRTRAASSGSWETIRDCDRFEATARKDVPLFLKLYFGTPYGSFRAGLERDLDHPSLPPELAWDLRAGERPVEISLATGEVRGVSERLKPDSLSHRLLSALASDFYRPHRVTALHEKLNPGERFHPDTSPARVHVAVRRLRRWLAGARVPLDIVESNGAYRLHADAALRLIVRLPETNRNSVLERIELALGRRSFSIVEAASALRISRRSALRSLDEAIASGLIVKRGAGPSTRYEWQELGSGLKSPRPRRTA